MSLLECEYKVRFKVFLIVFTWMWPYVIIAKLVGTFCDYNVINAALFYYSFINVVFPHEKVPRFS